MREILISRLVSQLWHIGSDSGRSIIGQMLVALMRGERPSKDVFGDALPTMEIRGDVAVIPVAGTLMLNVPQWFKEYGFAVTDANDIQEELAQAVNDPAVNLIALDIASPGGESIAGDKLFDLVEAAAQRKPVVAYSADGAMMCSSAYECAASATAIYTGKHACLGHIGSYRAMLDDTEYWKSLGLEWRIFRSGALKGIGEDGISPEQAKWLQGEADKFGARFRENVARYRTGIAEEDMQGQWYYGPEAVERGFAAGVATNLDEAVARLRKLV